MCSRPFFGKGNGHVSQKQFISNTKCILYSTKIVVKRILAIYSHFFPFSKNGIGHIVEVELISKCMCKVQWNIFRPFFASITREIIFNQREAIYRKAFWHLSCLDSMLLLYQKAFKLEIVKKQRKQINECFLKLNKSTILHYFLIHTYIHMIKNVL